VPLTGSRNGAQGEDFDGGHKIKSVKIVSSSKGKSTEVDAKFIITKNASFSSARVKSKRSSKSQN
jgi:hypothetical protein